MNYYDLREAVANIIPRTNFLFEDTFPPTKISIKTKGRKTGYKEYSLTKKSWQDKAKFLNTEEIGSFVEVSCRAAACPMPLNVDVWDGMSCPFKCKYCFAFTFRTYLYTAFFDNSSSLGVRHCNPEKFKKELDVYMEKRDQNPHDVKGEVAKAIAMGIPLRLGIRYEDFIPQEAKKGISLELLRYLSDLEYPVMINTKSDLIGRDDYVQALTSNKAKAAVHMTLISADNKLLKQLEPGAPSYNKRIETMKILSDNGIRVVARIEPSMPFLTDERGMVEQYMEDVWNAGVRNITFDTYSYSAKNPTMYRAFREMGIDWERLLLTGCDSQALGSLLLKEFMQLFKDKGFSCSTFDMGNVPDNNQLICCEVGDWFKTGYNWGSSVVAARYIKNKKGNAVSWSDFKGWVDRKGGFLSPALENDLHYFWNCEGNNDAYSHSWAQGMTAVGNDRDGLIWSYNKKFDFRENLFQNIRKK